MEEFLAPLGRLQVDPSTSQHPQYQLCSMVLFNNNIFPRQPRVFNSIKLHKPLAIMAILFQVFSILLQHQVSINILQATSLDKFQHQGRRQVAISTSQHQSQVCSLEPFIVYTSIFLHKPQFHNDSKLHKPSIIPKVVQALAYSIPHLALLSNLVQATKLLSYCIHRAATSNHKLVPRLFLITTIRHLSVMFSTMVYLHNLVFTMCTSSSLHNPTSHN